MNERDIHGKQIKRHNYVMWVFMGFIAYLLIMEHWAHIVPYLPYTFLLLCPLMHYFMHGGHHHGAEHNHHSHKKEE